jgi:hypothetical protein
MQNIEEIFKRIEENRKKLKDLKDGYKDGLIATGEWEDLNEEIKTLREKKKQVENRVKEQFSSEMIKMDDLKIDIDSDKEMLTDIAVSQMMKGENINITDKYDNEFEPVFSVKFKKVN